MSWIAVISTALSIFAAVIGYLKDRRLIAAATAEAVAAHLKEALDEIQKANAVRDAVRRDFDPGKLPDPTDPNLRD